jgi:16S rRNA (adenine1518-N6/adenine1519-N6)-dimethyltransferase
LQPAKKSLGQHWLHDPASLEAMCHAADVRSGDVVLEIGPGLGTLTKHLLDHGAEVTGLEYDKALIPGLQKLFGHLPSSQFWVEEGDIRTYNLSALPDTYKIVSNIPYYLTANLLRMLTDSDHKPTIAALLVQKEVAQRVAAGPGDLSLIAVIVQLEYEVVTGQIVPAVLFTPPPKVDSQILVLKQRSDPLWPDLDKKQFYQLLKAGFSNRRKTLHNSLAAGLHITKDQTAALLTSAGLKPSSRPQELALDDWHHLHLALGDFS